jgi:biotin transport system substrate-specific component
MAQALTAVHSRTGNRIIVLRIAAALACVLGTALAAQVRIPLPFSPVPITLQTFAVLLSGALLGPWAGAGAQALYLLCGAVGLPLFAATVAGLGGPTTGYLLAFPLAAFVAGAAFRATSPLLRAAGLLAATCAILGLGAAWLALWTGKSTAVAVALGVLPFLPGDAMKAAAVWMLATTWRRLCASGR